MCADPKREQQKPFFSWKAVHFGTKNLMAQASIYLRNMWQVSLTSLILIHLMPVSLPGSDSLRQLDMPWCMVLMYPCWWWERVQHWREYKVGILLERLHYCYSVTCLFQIQDAFCGRLYCNFPKHWIHFCKCLICAAASHLLFASWSLRVL